MVEPERIDALLREGYLADAHADSLMWNRDLLRGSAHGHLDLPRLKRAGSRMQCFTIVTRGYPFVDGFRLFGAWRGWPREALRGEWARACWQLDQLDRLCEESGGQVAIVKEAAQLDRNRAEERIAAVVGIEGAHALEGEPERLGQLWERGARFMSLTHLASNEAAGSSFPGGQRRGLTPYGRLLLKRMEELGMALDVAHASRRTIDESLEAFSGPVFCSHTGMRSAASSWRNLEDEHAREIARRGGVVCVIFATVFLGGRGFDCLLRHLERAIEIAGEDHVGFGSDFDGMIGLPRGMGDVTGLRALLAAMLERGLPEPTVRKVMGGNLRRFFGEKVLAAPAR